MRQRSCDWLVISLLVAYYCRSISGLAAAINSPALKSRRVNSYAQCGQLVVDESTTHLTSLDQAVVFILCTSNVSNVFEFDLFYFRWKAVTCQRCQHCSACHPPRHLPETMKSIQQWVLTMSHSVQQYRRRNIRDSIYLCSTATNNVCLLARRCPMLSSCQH